MLRKRQQRSRRWKPRFFRVLLLLLVGGLVFNYIRPLPHANALVAPLSDSAESVQLQWPAHGASAIGAQGFGVLETHGQQTPRPTASLAKVITALAVLEKHPITTDKHGATLMLTQADVDLFNKYYAAGGAYVQVEAGESITQYQALQAILLPSANNMADSLAIWAFGSMDAYVAYANDMVKRLGLTQTTVATDASGMSPDTKSTPTDLITLGSRALRNETIAEIVRQPSAIIPVHGIIYSANSRLGYNNIIGIKTGLTDEAGGCFLFAAAHKAGGAKPITIIGVISGAPTLRDALNGSSPLITSAKRYFDVKTPVKAGDIFATLSTPWLSSAQVIAKEDITLVAWKGRALQPRVRLSNINRSLPIGAQVGTAIVASGANKATTPLILQQAIAGPSWQWRLKRF